MTSVPKSRRGVVFTFDEIDAPEDELYHRLSMNNADLYPPSNKSMESNLSSDDEDRVPPPMEVEILGGTSSSSHYPNFAAWEREMTDALLGGTVRSKTLSQLQLADLKHARIHKRKERKLQAYQQLRSVKSDTSNDVSYGSTSCVVDEQSLKTAFGSRTMDNEENDSPNSPREITIEIKKSTLELASDMEHVHQENESAPKTSQEPPCPERMMNINSSFLHRPCLSAVSPPTSPQKQLNQKELAAIQEELAELREWATNASNATLEASSCASDDIPVPTTIQTTMRLRQSTPPSSPKSPRKPQTKMSDSNSGSRLSLEVPNLVSPSSTRKLRDDRLEICPKLVVDTALPTPKSAMKSTSSDHSPTVKKRVQFSKPEITDTIYRPKTPRDEVHKLFFQEEELLEWEYDEETTPVDRFEVVVREIDDRRELDADDESGGFQIGTPIISFHDTYSFSFQESDSDSEIEYTDSEDTKKS